MLKGFCDFHSDSRKQVLHLKLMEHCWRVGGKIQDMENQGVCCKFVHPEMSEATPKKYQHHCLHMCFARTITIDIPKWTGAQPRVLNLTQRMTANGCWEWEKSSSFEKSTPMVVKYQMIIPENIHMNNIILTEQLLLYLHT